MYKVLLDFEVYRDYKVLRVLILHYKAIEVFKEYVVHKVLIDLVMHGEVLKD